MHKVVIWKHNVRNQSRSKVILISDKISEATSRWNIATRSFNNMLNIELKKKKSTLSNVLCVIEIDCKWKKILNNGTNN